MIKASKLFNSEQRQRIDAAVAAAESQTSAEIVPVVATASGRYDRPEDIAGLLLGVILMTGVWLILPSQTAGEVGDWAGTTPWMKYIYMLIALLVGFLAGAIIADFVPALRRLFTPGKQMRDEVAAAARQAFVDRSIHHTASATGLLIYISLYERRAMILADNAVMQHLDQAALDAMGTQLIAKLSSGDIATALCDTIEDAGRRLSEVLPRETGDVNELPDSLVTLD